MENKINTLIDKELESIYIKYGNTYNSSHEAYAVLLEEFEEVQAEVDELDTLIKAIWLNVKNSHDINVSNNLCILKSIEGVAVRGIKELVQVAAVARKAIMSLPKSNMEGE